MTFIASMVEQHAEEAAFLILLHDYAVRAPHYDLDDLGRLDERIEAHLDGLRIAGPAGLQVLLTQLGPDTIGEMFASVVLAFQTQDVQGLARVNEHLKGATGTERGYLMALGWLEWEYLSPWIEAMLASSTPLFQRLGLAACGMHRRDPGPTLQTALAHADPGVLTRAARTAGELRRRELLPALHRHCQHGDVATRFWVNWASAQMGDEQALEPLRLFAEQPGQFQFRALCVLLAWQRREASISWICQLIENPGQLRTGIRAIGLLGDPLSVPWLIQQMHDLPYARVAGEAFSLITGADLALLDLELQVLPDFDVGPNDDPEDPNVSMDPDEDLPWPDPAAIATWWCTHGASLQTGISHMLGRQQSESSFLHALARGQQRQRIAAACALARWQPDQALFPTNAPARRQMSCLRTMQAPHQHRP
ncbi:MULTISPECIES: TIGR02270 family protein [unclassified Pseudomonas]|uniref:TIGR02270 family protein n=1 Tax=unclassified Pseudomonas TaxID=196821 RepID=UPI000A1EC773|nr:MULTISPECIES: TIGR02270 family protein [unclassified Pseudomonas]